MAPTASSSVSSPKPQPTQPTKEQLLEEVHFAAHPCQQKQCLLTIHLFPYYFIQLESLLVQLERETKMKLGVENMMEVYIKDKKRTKDLEAQLDKYNKRIESLTKEIEQLRKSAGKNLR
jgi:Hr1 repeat